jgi:hypothetical protein
MIRTSYYLLFWMNFVAVPFILPSYYPTETFGRVIRLSDLGNILAYYLDKTTLLKDEVLLAVGCPIFPPFYIDSQISVHRKFKKIDILENVRFRIFNLFLKEEKTTMTKLRKSIILCLFYPQRFKVFYLYK